MDQVEGVLKGKTALVTGAARGLGLHMAEALIEAGANVALVARSAGALDEQATRLGPRALSVTGRAPTASSPRSRKPAARPSRSRATSRKRPT